MPVYPKFNLQQQQRRLNRYRRRVSASGQPPPDQAYYDQSMKRLAALRKRLGRPPVG